MKTKLKDILGKVVGINWYVQGTTMSVLGSLLDNDEFVTMGEVTSHEEMVKTIRYLIPEVNWLPENCTGEGIESWAQHNGEIYLQMVKKLENLLFLYDNRKLTHRLFVANNR